MFMIRKKYQFKDVETQTEEELIKDSVLRFKTKELFVCKTGLITESTEKIIEFHDFIKEIEDESTKNIEKITPKFKLAGADFSMGVVPDNSANNGSGFIGFCLFNNSDEDQTISGTVKVSGEEAKFWEKKKFFAGKEYGIEKFMSHEEYREWARNHGDVLRLEVVLTLHKKGEGDGWTRYCYHYTFYYP